MPREPRFKAIRNCQIGALCYYMALSAPVFILVGALVRNVVVKKGKVKTRVKELVAA